MKIQRAPIVGRPSHRFERRDEVGKSDREGGEAEVSVEVGEGAPGSLVVVDSAMTGSKTEDGKNDTVEPSGSKTPFQATE